jgi:hypothetical protein
VSRGLLVGVAAHVWGRERGCAGGGVACVTHLRGSLLFRWPTQRARSAAQGGKRRAPRGEKNTTPPTDPRPLAPQPTPTHTLVQFTLSLYSSSVRVPSALKPRSEAVSQPLMVAHCVCKGRAKVCQRERGRRRPRAHTPHLTPALLPPPVSLTAQFSTPRFQSAPVPFLYSEVTILKKPSSCTELLCWARVCGACVSA